MNLYFSHGHDDPAKHLFPMHLQQFAVPRVRLLLDTGRDLSLDTCEVDGSVKYQNRMICASVNSTAVYHLMPCKGGDVDIRQTPGA